MQLEIITPTEDHASTTAEVEDITPAMAREMLYTNAHNRPVSLGTIARYASDMRSGNWAFTADPLRFSCDGKLLDGQHRLEALAQLEDDKAIRMLVVRGLASESQMFMDQGRKRQPGQQLRLFGVKDSFATASAVRLLLVTDSGNLFKDHIHLQAISTPALLDWVRNNTKLVEDVGTFATPVLTNDARGSVALCAAYMFARVAPLCAVQDFFLALKTGHELAIDNPILQLRNRLHNIKNTRMRMSQRDQLGLFIQTWNAWRDGEKIERLGMPKGGWNETNFPTAH